eukprot:TRINITY_DN14756_c0_g1_i1.p1 TRINITY_DN14756_c0_g1~~TRINITY_DN14756_c0_g1_i1.p1  ORF type:complete len:115 (+),score=1.32 TRINITY_DN14756_c0_g1_i1:186-530(+)
MCIRDRYVRVHHFELHCRRRSRSRNCCSAFVVALQLYIDTIFSKVVLLSVITFIICSCLIVIFLRAFIAVNLSRDGKISIGNTIAFRRGPKKLTIFPFFLSSFFFSINTPCTLR